MSCCLPGGDVTLQVDEAELTHKAFNPAPHQPLGLDVTVLAIGGSEQTIVEDGNTMTGDYMTLTDEESLEESQYLLWFYGISG